MKKIMMIGLMVVTAAGALFANGSKEEAPVQDTFGRGPGGQYARNQETFGRGRGMDQRDPRGAAGGLCWYDEEGNLVTPETIEVEGVLVLEEATLPYIEQNGEKVFLMVPRFAFDQVELEDGESIKVSGYDMTENARMAWDYETESLYLHVVTAEIDGETYTLDNGMGRLGGTGLGGRMGGAGGRRPRRG